MREYLARMADVEPAVGRRRRRRDRAAAVTRIAGLTGATLPTAPTVCHECVWWQSRAGRRRRQAPLDPAAPRRSGAPGARVYYDDDGRLLGSMQYGPSDLFPRAAELPAGPPTEDAVLVTCAYLVDSSKPWVMQSLFLAAIGEARDKGARALEAFAYRYREGESAFERFHVHKTIFPRDFLADFGFQTVRARARRARAARARRPRAGGRGHAREGAARRARGVLPAPAPAAAP